LADVVDGMKSQCCKWNESIGIVYRDSAMRFSTSGFLHGSVSAKPLIIPLGPFEFFPKIRRDICSSRCTSGIVDTGGKWKNLKSEKFSIFLLDTFG
jgi:hypothetical protein